MPAYISFGDAGVQSRIAGTATRRAAIIAQISVQFTRNDASVTGFQHGKSIFPVSHHKVKPLIASVLFSKQSIAVVVRRYGAIKPPKVS